MKNASLPKSESTAPSLADLRICIAGGGIGGTSSALALARAGFRNITVFEAASRLGEVGAGINVGPNLYRLLRKWGVEERLNEIGGVGIQGVSIRKGDTDRELCYTSYEGTATKFNTPAWIVCHRADLHRCMVEAVYSAGVDIQLGTEVTSIDFERPAVKIRKRKAATSEERDESEWRDFDVVIAADGVKSNIRRQMLEKHGEIDEVADTGQAAYRILIPRELMAKDPELLQVIDTPIITRWISHRRHIIAYPISNSTIYNISTAHPDAHIQASESWTSRGSKADMLKTWHDYCPRIQKMLQLVQEDEVVEWKLRVHAPLKTWTEGKVVLIGDASHPTLPHLAQGAAQAVEDSAVLAHLLCKVSSTTQIPEMLKLFERCRKTRCEELVDMAYQNGKRMHLASGAEMEERDKLFEAVRNGGPNPDKSVDPEVQQYLFGYDCVAEAEKLYQAENPQA